MSRSSAIKSTHDLKVDQILEKIKSVDVEMNKVQVEIDEIQRSSNLKQTK